MIHRFLKTAGDRGDLTLQQCLLPQFDDHLFEHLKCARDFANFVVTFDAANRDGLVMIGEPRHQIRHATDRSRDQPRGERNHQGSEDYPDQRTCDVRVERFVQ